MSDDPLGPRCRNCQRYNPHGFPMFVNSDIEQTRYTPACTLDPVWVPVTPGHYCSHFLVRED